MDKNINTFICDIGTGFLKLGCVGENFPRKTFPTIVGRPILRTGNFSSSTQNSLLFKKDIIVGDLCDSNEGSLDVTFPVRNGIIVDPENMNHIWDYCFKEALFDYSPNTQQTNENLSNPEDVPPLDDNLPENDIGKQTNELLEQDFSEKSIFLTEAAENPKKNRTMLYKTMFERYGFNRVKIVPQAILTLYAQGLTTGLVFDSGDGVSHAMPVFQSYLVTPSVRRLDVAGSHITSRLIKLLQLAGYYLNSTADLVLSRKIKEKLCFVAGDLERIKKLEEETTYLREEYRLDNGQKIYLEKERYLAPECLFQPNFLGLSAPGVHETIFNCVTAQSTNISIRKPLFGHIVLSGGTTMLKGFPTRLEKEVGNLIRDNILGGDSERLKNYKLRIEDPPRRKIMVFHGASLFAKIIENNNDLWITKKDWEEKGENVEG